MVGYNGGISKNINIIFSFLQTSLASNPQPQLMELTVHHVLKSMLEILTKVENPKLRNPVIEIMKLLNCGMREIVELQEKVVKHLCDFIVSNLPFDYERVFLTLTVINQLNKALITKAIVFISEQVDKIESQRGAGRDLKLRRLFENLKNKNLDL